MGFQQGLSGLNAASKNLDVIGHNIANSGTTGFKSSRTEFAEMVASAIGTSGGVSTSVGTSVGAISQQFTQGNITVTGNNLDVAINGNGFFILQQPDGSTAYTRDGSFKLDSLGNMVTNNGERVMGYVNGALQPLTFPTSQAIAAKQTTSVTASFNLDARAINAAGDPSATPAVAATPRSTYGTSISVYDSQGVATPLNMYFEKNGANTWDVYTQLDDLTTSPPSIPPAAGRMIADKNGAITAALSPTDPTKTGGTDPADWPTDFTFHFNGPDASGVYAIREATINVANAADAWEFTYSDAPANTTVASARLRSDLISYDEATSTWSVPAGATLNPATLNTAPATTKQSFELGLTINPSPANPNSPQAPGGYSAPGPFPVTLDLSKVTQYGTKFAISDLRQDGYTAGQLSSINVGSDGVISTTYSNGATTTSGQLALATFRNTQGLASIGNNNWVATHTSGDPMLGKPTDGNFGGLHSGALEDSNVDLTAELVNMMTAQRAYQANAQTIKTQDQVMSTLVNLR